MRLRIKNPFVLPILANLPLRIRRLNQIAVFEHFSKPEALLEVTIATTASDIHVVDITVPAAYSACRVDGQEGVPTPILVLFVAGGAPGVVDALHDFGTEVIGWGFDVET